MSEQVEVYELSDPLSFDANRTDRFVRHDDYATLQAENAKLRQALAGSVSKDFTDRINSTDRDKNIDECIAEGIRHANKEHDELKAECERLRAEIDCPHRLARHSKRLVEQLRAELSTLQPSGEVIEYKPETPIFSSPIRTIKWYNGCLPVTGTKLYIKDPK